MPWRKMTFYHGTVGPHARHILSNGAKWNVGSPNTDFSTGFYTTRVLDQAIRHANSRFDELMDDYHRLGTLYPENAVVIELSALADGLCALRTLAFVEPTSGWRDFVTHCRSPSHGHTAFGKFYEAVYGPVSAFPAGTPVAGWEQVSFHSDYAVSRSILTIENAARVGNLRL
jgi:hypothetical protein